MDSDVIKEFFTRFLDGYHTSEQIKDFVLAEFSMLNTEQDAVVPATSDRIRVQSLLIKIGWLEEGAVIEELSSDHSEEENFLFDQPWIGDRVLIKGALVPGGGCYLDNLDAKSEMQELVNENLEILLRHVEVNRRRAISKFTLDLSEAQAYKEKIWIAILFCRFALRHGDLRFLNAALKLNDWLMADYRKKKNSEIQLLFLLSLVEQELCVKELMK